MNLYFHHVGEAGSDEDFPKTVWAEIDLNEAESVCPKNVKYSELFSYLRACFSDGVFNAWGVPSGAKSVIKNLRPGDGVFLVESLSRPFGVSCFAKVGAYVPDEYQELSTYLWQSQRFPYIFFFNTEKIKISWPFFASSIGYKPNYNPAGTFNRISDERINAAGGVAELLKKLIVSKDSLSPLKVSDEVGAYYSESELGEFANGMNEIVSVYEDPAFSLSARRKRCAMFSVAVKRQYDYMCCVCGARRVDLKGRPEVEAAHILPVQENGSNDVRNGLSLCKLHHWAFDKKLFQIDELLTIKVDVAALAMPGSEWLANIDGSKLQFPSTSTLRPHTAFLIARNKLPGS